MESPTTTTVTHRPLWLVHEVTVLAHWVDEFTMAWSALFLGFVGAMVALDQMTHLVSHLPILLNLTGIAAAIGIETQGRTLIRRGKMAWDHDRRSVAIWWMVGAAPIMAVLFQLAWAFMLQYSESITEVQALEQIGIAPSFMNFERAAILVYLIIMSGFVYYTRPKASLQEKIAAKREEAAMSELDAEVIVAQQKKRDAMAWAARQTTAAALTGRYSHQALNTPNPAMSVQAAHTSAVDRALSGSFGNTVAPSTSFFSIEPIGDDDNNDDDHDPEPTPPTQPRRARNSGSLNGMGTRGRPSLPITAYNGSHYTEEMGASRNMLNLINVKDVKDFLQGESRRFTLGQRTTVPTQQEVLWYLNSCGYGLKTINNSVKSAIANALHSLAQDGVTLAWDKEVAAQAVNA